MGFSLVVAAWSLICIQLFVVSWTAAHHASLSFTISWSLLKLMSTELVMPFNHLILFAPFSFCLQSFPALGFFSELALCIIWPKKSVSLSVSPSNDYSGLLSFRIDWFDLLAIQGTLTSLLQTTVQKHQFFGSQLSLWSISHIRT